MATNQWVGHPESMPMPNSNLRKIDREILGTFSRCPSDKYKSEIKADMTSEIFGAELKSAHAKYKLAKCNFRYVGQNLRVPMPKSKIPKLNI